MDLTIVIPHRGPSLGLWTTICSCEENLLNTKLDYQYVIVTNGDPVDTETQFLLKFLRQANRLLEHVHSEAPLTPPQARTRGAAVADGDVLFFSDNHCLFNSRFFERSMLDIEKHDMDILHAPANFWIGDIIHYHYHLKLKFNFWGYSGTLPLHQFLPYRCASAGHGAFFVKRTVWDAVGGYGPDDLFEGYGGEELSFDLKCWRMGYESWIDPKLLHYHWAGTRPYAKHYTDSYYTNMMTAALVVGGTAWLDNVYESFSTAKHLRLNPKVHMFDLLQTAYKRGIAYSRELDSKSVHSLDNTLAMFIRDQIAY